MLGRNDSVWSHFCGFSLTLYHQAHFFLEEITSCTRGPGPGGQAQKLLVSGAFWVFKACLCKERFNKSQVITTKGKRDWCFCNIRWSHGPLQWIEEPRNQFYAYLHSWGGCFKPVDRISEPEETALFFHFGNANALGGIRAIHVRPKWLCTFRRWSSWAWKKHKITNQQGNMALWELEAMDVVALRRRYVKEKRRGWEGCQPDIFVHII